MYFLNRYTRIEYGNKSSYCRVCLAIVCLDDLLVNTFLLMVPLLVLLYCCMRFKIKNKKNNIAMYQKNLNSHCCHCANVCLEPLLPIFTLLKLKGPVSGKEELPPAFRFSDCDLISCSLLLFDLCMSMFFPNPNEGTIWRSSRTCSWSKSIYP